MFLIGCSVCPGNISVLINIDDGSRRRWRSSGLAEVRRIITLELQPFSERRWSTRWRGVVRSVTTVWLHRGGHVGRVVRSVRVLAIGRVRRPGWIVLSRERAKPVGADNTSLSPPRSVEITGTAKDIILSLGRIFQNFQ
jgi:hypothetical protein